MVLEFVKQCDYKHTSRAIYRKPWSIHDASVNKHLILYEMQPDFPQPAYKAEAV